MKGAMKVGRGAKDSSILQAIFSVARGQQYPCFTA